ncbi:hypothetical protein PPTG_00288 [Phytophthora nicotianae INRA-310]|uniref:Uncharacterized protein n=1 Tax=Phytophthora nicotianae (strain INRA-310) TaxID=761204 RepID=W2REF3_PHYN3|nr:hypothetical protein PPTG_00288 [Phytophthora nicotianae INRA-310]ETN23762.1 hypothetical protein PPTG_00288 [Phytophthora nicotianae INRA-310]
MKKKRSIIRQISRLIPKASTEVVKLSYWVFAVWWVIILAVHVATCVYTALYAYCYWKLQDTFLNLYFESYEIGMPSPYHHTIATVHMTMSILHAACILLMLGGSIYQRSLAFTPWASCDADAKHEETKSDRTSSVILQSFTKIYDKISDRHGLCGVNSDHFHGVLILREVVETALQTVQAYRMSLLLPRTLLNRFFVILLAINCWSSVIVYSCFFKRDEARRRLACIVLDCILDFMSCMGVELIVLFSYVGDYDPSILGFPEIIWYNDEWIARALNELKMVLVVSWTDLASRSIFSFGLILTTMSMKELLARLPRSNNRVTQLDGTSMKVNARTESDTFWDTKLNTVAPKTATPTQPISKNSQRKLLVKNDSYRGTNLRSRGARVMLRTAHLLFGLWGLLVLGFHIQASMQPILPQCLMQVRPWAVSRTSCYLAGLDCHTLGISGKKDEVDEKWREFDASTIVQLLIRHCTEFEMPDIFSEFHELVNVKVYNTTINEWGGSAAITSTNQPGMSSLLFVRVNMTDGLLPVGLLSTDFPQTLYDIEFCVTNLRTLPDDLDSKWPLYAIIQLEYSQLTTVPAVIPRLEPYYLALTGNPLSEIPPEVFEVQGMLFLSISNMNIRQLPRNVTQLSAELSWIFIGDTNISFFWAWTDELVERMKGRANPWLAGPSPYCDDLEKIKTGAATEFSVPLSPEYSQTLMDPSEANRDVILKAVRCDPTIGGLFYPLEIEDSINAISTPPSLV